MGKKQEKKKKETPYSLLNISKNFTNHRVRFFLGLFLTTISIYLLIAFISFFFTGWADISKFDIAFATLFKDADITVKNWTGKLGAYLANLLINQWFGLSSISIVFLSFLTGIRMLGIKLLSLKKALFHSALLTIWTSIVLGFIFYKSAENTFFLFGGAHGYFMSKWLTSAIGAVGTILLLLSSAILYIGLNFSSVLVFFEKLFTSPPETADLKPSAFKNNSSNEKQEEDESIPKKEPSSSPFEQIPEEENNIPEEQPEDPATIEALTSEEAPIDFSSTIDLDPEYTGQKETENTDIQEDFGLTIEKGPEEESYTHNTNIPLGDYDPTLDLSSYQLPDLELLEDHKIENSSVTEEELISNKNKIVNTLEDYKIQIKTIKATVGPTVTLYEIIPAPGVRISKIKNLEDDIALSLAALGIRIIAPIPGKGTIGIEVPNSVPEVVSMKTIISSSKFQNSKYELPIALGKTISNETFVLDLAKAPHMLVAGATGQGKSVGLNAIITSLLYKKHPSQLKFVLVDPKKVELNIYSMLERHFLAKLPDEEEPIITDVQKVVSTLNSLCIEMDNRYDLLKKATARNIKEYNHKFVKRKLNPEKGHRFLPYIVVIIDEFADLIMTAGKDVEMPIARIAQLARAVGIHMIVATQRPSTNIITGVIKANFPTRVAFKVASMIDSRTILDSPGANQLIGRGDMLISQGSDLIRVQCAFVDTPEVENITEYIGEQKGYGSAFILPEYIGDSAAAEAGEVDLGKKDAMFEEAAKIVVANQSGSTSLIQRRFSIGYNRAGRIIDQLEAAGIVGPFEGSKARQVLIADEIELEKLFQILP